MESRSEIDNMEKNDIRDVGSTVGLGLLGTPGTHWYPLHWYPLVPTVTLWYQWELTGTRWYSLVPFGTRWNPLVLVGTH